MLGRLFLFAARVQGAAGGGAHAGGCGGEAGGACARGRRCAEGGGRRCGAGGSTGRRGGDAACDEYLDKMARCITRINAEAQPPMRNAMDDSRKAWQENAKTPEGRAALETTCRQALDAAKSAAAAMGCEW